ncbi:hypothetical protein Tco_0453311 [Tanacetum coccineum]
MIPPDESCMSDSEKENKHKHAIAVSDNHCSCGRVQAAWLMSTYYRRTGILYLVAVRKMLLSTRIHPDYRQVTWAEIGLFDIRLECST